jgi:hypothetical protein
MLANGISRKPAVYVFLASMIELGSAIPLCTSECRGLRGFALILGLVSAVCSLVLVFTMKTLQVSVIRQVAMFLCVWWVIGGMLLTFVSPFQVMGNGYFAVVFATLSSFALLNTPPSEEENPNPSSQSEV